MEMSDSFLLFCSNFRLKANQQPFYASVNGTMEEELVIEKFFNAGILHVDGV